nr:MBL fold metallo-hydrolase [Sphingomonas sp. CDS-1]
MPTTLFSKSLRNLGGGIWAWIAPPGTWNYSNAGLITDGDEALLVDTLVDERLTGEMLDAMRTATGFGADRIATLVNTNETSNHTWGNGLLKAATSYASAAAAQEMATDTGPQQIGKLLGAAPGMGELGQWFIDKFATFDFEGLTPSGPDRTFSSEITLKVGKKDVHLIPVGPANTPGDIIVHSPVDRVVFAGDVISVGVTPITWTGPVSGWIKACDRIMALDVDTIVPGHGPLTDKAGVRKMRDYLTFVDQEARKRHTAGMDAWATAQDIALGEFARWPDQGKLAVTVGTIFREIDQDASPPNLVEYFERIQQLDKKYAAG